MKLEMIGESQRHGQASLGLILGLNPNQLGDITNRPRDTDAKASLDQAVERIMPRVHAVRVRNDRGSVSGNPNDFRRPDQMTQKHGDKDA